MNVLRALIKALLPYIGQRIMKYLMQGKDIRKIPMSALIKKSEQTKLKVAADRARINKARRAAQKKKVAKPKKRR